MPAKLTLEKFIEKANIKHKNKYDYSLVNYINAQTKVKIICPKHGEFEQQPNNHLYGQGCIWCMGDNVRKARKFTKDQWIERFKIIHGDRYDYSLVKIGEGAGSKFKIIIICSKHGEFLQTPNAHLHMSNNCPYCNISKGEDEIEKYLIKEDIHYIRDYRINDCINPITFKKLPFDFYLPKYNKIIEFHGEQHYKKTGYFERSAGGLKGLQYRDKIKKDYCVNNNIELIEIKYTEINNINNILKEKL